jgi:hypothetical protein
MRTILPLILLAPDCWADGVFGTWKMNPARSRMAGSPRLESFAVRIEPHAKGEVFTLDKTDRDGRAITCSTVLYFDGKPRVFQDAGCSGTQSSRRVDKTTVEVVRNCEGGAWTRLVWRLAEQSRELILDVAEQQSDGRRLEKRLVLERQ